MYEKLCPCIRGCRRLFPLVDLLNLKKSPRPLSVNYHQITYNYQSKVSLHSKYLMSFNTDNFLYNVIRTYAKGQDKRKEKKGAQKIDELELSQTFELDDLYAEFQKPIDAMRKEYIEQLTLRTAAGALDTLKVNYQGKEYILQDLVDIGKKNPKTIVLEASAFPGAIPAINKAIMESGLGLNPQQDGLKIYLQIPKVTKEHREALAKNAKLLFNKCKDSINRVKLSNIDWVKKNITSEDVAFRLTNSLVAIGDKYVAEAEKMMKTKQADLLKTDN